jgi:hypothetical protein
MHGVLNPATDVFPTRIAAMNRAKQLALNSLKATFPVGQCWFAETRPHIIFWDELR